MKRSLLLGLAIATACGCAPQVEEVCHNVIMPEQRTIDYRDPAQVPPVRIPDTVAPRTVLSPQPDAVEWQLSLDEFAKSSAADVEPGDVERVQKKLEGARVRLAKEDSSSGQAKPE